jgi:hypothetical protein
MRLAGGVLAQLLLVALLIGYGSLFTVYPKASAISSPPWLLRLLPAGAVAGWGLQPLENAALSRRTPSTDIYSPVRNIGDIWSLEEGSDEGSIVLDIDEIGLDAILQQFV